MLPQPPGTEGVMPVGAPASAVPNEQAAPPVPATTPAPQAPATDDLTAALQPAPPPEMGSADGQPLAPAAGTTPTPAPAPPVQPTPEPDPRSDPALRPWVQQAAQLAEQTQAVQTRLQALQSEQATADQVYQRLIYQAQSPEQRAQIEAQYWAERQPREQQWKGLTDHQGRLSLEDQRMGVRFDAWQREREMARIADPMTVELIVRQTQAQNPDPQFPVEAFRQYVAAFPPESRLVARDQWVQQFQAQRFQARQTAAVDKMGPAQAGATRNWGNEDGYSLILNDLESLAR